MNHHLAFFLLFFPTEEIENYQQETLLLPGRLLGSCEPSVVNPTHSTYACLYHYIVQEAETMVCLYNLLQGCLQG